ncbi:GPI anchored endo-1,3(4)-beta-glucanase [Cordyceps fumosorosea ARSEF 2679]|uniref:GPI anchored endo-1,3(4)-beta-glucanase n=1 Tax=Cordyceps fumosorosea (strain ARSEF 2679) TaxID=1081104 RepID=A0A167V7X0_CORFA|nr:GPI anchored endo-1,3(4)-beta-glucanase [Cordyceps fumosorosea ARSEF 2679]OAA62324.1 GPI anchored endo-1,3(4)-beta-glucanase [Cordyceps fumosorosea ARSEF 2679]
MAYSLVTSYAGDALINGFNWVDTRDPSNGYVKYQSQTNAASEGLFAVDELTGVVRLGVDDTNTYAVSSGRPSIRIESKLAYNHGLFIGDFLHMPPSQCGVWPAFWAYGPNWPAGGEIDIIEGANTAHRNIISAHTTPGCKLGPDVLAMAAGTAQTTDCDVGNQNIGCGYVPAANDTSSYGDTFNAVGGGIYAMLWDDDYIKIWHFDRASAPADIAAKQPDPEGWPRPQAVYGGDSCDVSAKFRDMSIVLNVNFCGDYGNAVWASDGCTALAPTCAEWVGQNPAAFAHAYWDVNYIDAYVLGAASNGTATPSEKTPSGPSSKTSKASLPSFTSVPGPANGIYTHFPARNSTRGNATSSVSSSSPFLSATAENKLPENTPTAAAGPIPTGSLLPRPAPSANAHANPANIDDFSYLGCFGSSSGFASFTKVADSADMDLGKCTGLCRGKKYAGVFDTTCYCASELDPDTRVSADACDTECPGDDSQFCGGRLGRRNHGGSGLPAFGPIASGPIAATANVTLPESTSSVVSGGAVPLRTDGGSAADGSVGGYTFKPSGSGQPTPTGPGSPVRVGNDTSGPSFVNPTAPEILSGSSGNFASESAVASGTGAAAAASPTISSAAKFNVTSFGRLSASGPSGFHRALQSKSSSAPADIVAARLNSTIPRISTLVSPSGTGIAASTVADGPVVTIPVYPISMKNVTEPTPSSPRIGTADGPVVTISVYPIPMKNATEPTPSSPRIAAAVPGASAAVPKGPAAVPSGPAPAMLFPNSTTLVGRRLLAARGRPDGLLGLHPGSIHGREAADFLLTVYAAVAKEEPPKQPPGMGNTEPHAPPPVPQAKLPSASDVAAATPAPTPAGRSTTTTVVTTVSYETVYPSNPSRIVTEVFVTTIVRAHCGCTETPVPVMTVPMSTKVVSCSACGRNGESTVTITVPCSVSLAATPTPPASGAIAPPPPHASAGGEPPAITHKPAPPAPGKYEPPKPSNKVTPAAPAPSGNTPPPPAHKGDEPWKSGASVPPAPSGGKSPSGPPSSPPIVVAGASGFKVTSLLFTTVLAMVLLL